MRLAERIGVRILNRAPGSCRPAPTTRRTRRRSDAEQADALKLLQSLADGRTRGPGFLGDIIDCGRTRARGVVGEREKHVPVDMQRCIGDDAPLAALGLRLASRALWPACKGCVAPPSRQAQARSAQSVRRGESSFRTVVLQHVLGSREAGSRSAFSEMACKIREFWERKRGRQALDLSGIP